MRSGRVPAGLEAIVPDYGATGLTCVVNKEVAELVESTYLQNRGVAHESCFPYQDHNMPCITCAERDGEAIKTQNNVALFDITQRKDYLAFVGPMMCVFEVFADFFGYHQGVYSHVTGASVGYHCVEVIGYDDLKTCWICKNSWGTGWGDSGYFLIAYGQCQIDSTFPFWGISRTQWWS